MIMKKNVKKLIIMTVFFILLLCLNSKVNAASISISPSNPKVGDKVTITVTVSNVNTATITANVSGVATGTIKVVEGSLSGQPSTFSKSESFDCNTEGTIHVSISSDSTAVLNGEYVDVGASASVKVSPKDQGENNSNNNNNNNSNTNNEGNNEKPKEETPTTTKSNNANLKNLGITPNDFKGFKPGTTSYDVTVPNNVEQVSVYATKQDAKATLKGTGKQKLNVGKNTLSVVVTAEDGTQKTYTINVTREEATTQTNENNTTPEENTNQENSNNQNEEKPQENSSNFDLQKLEIKGYTLNPKFSPEMNQYTLDINGDVSNLDVIAEGNDQNVKIEIAGNTNLVDGENTITVLVYNEETKKNSTYQIFVNKTNIDMEGLNSTLNDAVKKANKIRYILLGVFLFIVVCIIVFIIVKHRYNNNENEAYEYDDEDRERLNLDEEEDFFHRVNKEIVEKPIEEKVTTIETANSIVESDSRQEDLSDNVIPNEEEPQEEAEEYFRTSRAKKKGKHF